MNSTQLWNLHQRHKLLTAKASRDILKFRVSEMVFPALGFQEVFSTTDAKLFRQNTWNTGNNAFEMSQAFQDKGCQPPTSLNIENWWETDDKWHHNAHSTWRYCMVKKTCKKDVVGIVTFDLTVAYFPPMSLLLILQWHTGVCEELLMLTVE